MCATPIIPQRRLLAAGAKKCASAWGTAEALGAGYGMLIEEDGGLARAQPYLPAAEADTPFPLEGDLGNIEPVEFAPAFTMRYDPGAIGILMAQLFGTAGGPTDLTQGAYGHKLQWADENYGEFATFCVERPSKIYEVSNAKPYMLDLTIADGFLKGALGLRGNTLITNSVLNTLTQIDALTYADRGNRIKFSQLSVYMEDQSGGSPISAGVIEVSDLSIHYERPQDAPHKAGSEYIIEPIENAAPIVTIDLTFPRMNTTNDDYFDDFIAETEKKMLLRFYGATLGIDEYRLELWFPRLRVIAADYAFDEVVPGHITLQAEEAVSIPTGMTYKRPWIYMVNTRSTDYIA